MNYLAHGRLHLDEPYFLAGTAVPDWLSALDRRVKARSKSAQPLVDDADPQVAAVARGVIRHHRDDRWFHRTRAFVELNARFTLAVRDVLSPERGFRPALVGHILVELLLDDELERRSPGLLDRYYAALESVEPALVQAAVRRISGASQLPLADFVQLFLNARFLYDYREDETLRRRINNVLGRVALEPLPESVLPVFAQARTEVRSRADELLTPPQAQSPDETRGRLRDPNQRPSGEKPA